MLRKTLANLAAASMLFFATPASAQEVIAEYIAWLDAADTYTSSGKRLTSFGAILAQDRANFHRFGIRQEQDWSDPVFGSRDMRARLPQLYKAGRRVEAYIIRNVVNGWGHLVFIQIMGKNGRVTHVNVYEGAG